MDKKKIIFNILLLVIFILLVVAISYFYRADASRIEKEKAENEAKEAENVTLTDIGYGSEIEKLGYTNASGILGAFINAYNSHDGSSLISIMDITAMYIYQEAENEGADFETKYVETLSNPTEEEELVLMTYTLKNLESNLIDAVDNTNVQLTLVENSEIEDTGKYLSKMTATIRTVSDSEGLDQENNLEFLLVHKDDAYYIINYYAIDEDGNKLENDLTTISQN